MQTVFLDASKMKTMEEAQEHLRESFAFPDYFGGGLDALYDCLTELCEDITIAVPKELSAPEFLGSYGARMINVFQDAGDNNSHLHIELV